MENKTVLYFEAPDGISGDMTLGALIDLGVDIEEIRRELDKFVPGEYTIYPRPFERNGIHGTSLEVFVDDDHAGDEEESGLGDLVHEFNYSDKDETPDVERGLGDLVHEFDFAEVSAEDTSLSDHVHEYEYFSESHHGGSHVHRNYGDIRSMITASRLSKKAKVYAIAIFEAIAIAEAAVHKVSLDEVKFHEVGAMDSIIDIVGTAIAIDILGVDEFYTSAPHDGSGTIVCQHGLIPVPVPAVVEMAKNAGIPIVIENDVKTEMITPTGFGIIKGLQAKFEPHFGLFPQKTGYGFGKRDTGRLGAVRVTLGEKYEEE
jgi:Uncharacterized conserved protein